MRNNSEAISRKRCKIGGKLLLITNRKSHMGFRLVPNSVTLNDLEWRSRPNSCVISPNSVALWADCVKVVEDIRILSTAEMQAKQCIVFNDILFMAILAGDPPSDSVKVRHSPLASENLTNNQS